VAKNGLGTRLVSRQLLAYSPFSYYSLSRLRDQSGAWQLYHGAEVSLWNNHAPTALCTSVSGEH